MTIDAETQLFYIFDLEAFYFDRSNFKHILVVGNPESVYRAADECPGRYEVYTSLRDFNDALSYYRATL